MNRDTFKCLSGNQCVLAESSCNELKDCDDGSDELGCDTTWVCMKRIAMTHLLTSSSCADNVHCTHIFGKCNGTSNCANGSDEVGCATTTHGATLEAVTGYASTILAPAIHEHLFL